MKANLFSSEEQHVLALEDEYVAAEISRDEATLRQIVHDRFIYNANNGQTSGKADLINSILGWNMTAQTITERTVLVEGDTAVVFGTTALCFASEGSEEIKSLLRYTATYIKRDEQWQMLALQMARRDTQAES